MEYMDYLNKLKLKYNYDDNIIIMLSMIIPNMIDYFGHEYEEKILQNIYDCKIHVKKEGEDPNNYISKELGIVDNYVSGDKVDGYATTRPKIKDGELIKKSIIYLINDNEIEPINQNLISTLVHELCHLIKQQKPRIINNTIELKTGYQMNYYNFDGALLNRDFVALEETTNSYDEKQIMTRIFGLNNYQLTGSGYIVSEHYLNLLINSLKTNLNINLNKYLIEDEMEGSIHLEYLFGPFGICLLNDFLNQCIDLNLLQKDDFYIQNNKIEGIFDTILNSIDKLKNNYSLITNKEYENLKLK